MLAPTNKQTYPSIPRHGANLQHSIQRSIPQPLSGSDSYYFRLHVSLIDTGPASRAYSFYRCRSLLAATSTTPSSPNITASHRQKNTDSNTIATTETPSRIQDHIKASQMLQNLPLRNPRTLSPPEEEEMWTRVHESRELHNKSQPLPRTPIRGTAVPLITPPTSAEGPHMYSGAAAHSPVPTSTQLQAAPCIQSPNQVSLLLTPPTTIYELTPTLLSSLSHALTYSPDFHQTLELKRILCSVGIFPLVQLLHHQMHANSHP